MFDTRLQKLKDHFGISEARDWQGVRPEWILAQDGCGPRILEYIRLMLAVKELTLKDDKTPEYWRANKTSARVCEVLGNEEMEDDDGSPAAKDRGVICPFTVLIDTAEQYVVNFTGLRTDAGKPLIVPTQFKSLGRFPQSRGDYSLDSTVGGFGRCHVERKSMADAHSTLLGWRKRGEDVGRRDRFESELQILSDMEAGVVVVECSFRQLLENAPQWGVKTATENAKTLRRTLNAYFQDYEVRWFFIDAIRDAEGNLQTDYVLVRKTIYDWLDRWYTKQVAARKVETKEAAKRRQKLLPQSQAAPPAMTPVFDSELASI